MLQDGRFWPVVGAFFLAGVLLSLTPCVLPMLPIVSSIIAGHGIEVSRGRGFTLAAAYSLGMAFVYTGLGVAAGLAGEGLAAALQTPWVLGGFGVALVALALSMFGRLRAAPSGRVRDPADERVDTDCRPGASPGSAQWAACRPSSSVRASQRRLPVRWST